MMDGLFLLLGSNARGSNGYLEAARVELSILLGDTIAISSIYETEPWGNLDQEWFHNQVLLFKLPQTTPSELLKEIKQMEKKLGRKTREKWGPREIDIDILYWSDLIVQDESLTIPHSSIQERKFTLKPLVEIAPGKVHPLLHKRQEELLRECKDPSQVIRLANS